MTAFVSFERVFEVLDAPIAHRGPARAVDLVDPVGRIEFDHVSFRYPTAPRFGRVARGARRSGAPTPSGASSTTSSLVIEPGESSPWSARRERASRPWPRWSPASTTSPAGRSASTATTCATHAGVAAGRYRGRRPGSASVPRVGGGEPALRAAGRHQQGWRLRAAPLRFSNWCLCRLLELQRIAKQQPAGQEGEKKFRYVIEADGHAA